MRRLVLATRNTKKIVELDRILTASGLVGPDAVELSGPEVYASLPDIPETGLTFAENALIKVRRGRFFGMPGQALPMFFER